MIFSRRLVKALSMCIVNTEVYRFLIGSGWKIIGGKQEDVDIYNHVINDFIEVDKTKRVNWHIPTPKFWVIIYFAYCRVGKLYQVIPL